MNTCRKEYCFMPEATCGLGHLDPTKCPEWTGTAEMQGDGVASTDEILLPWSGSAMGLADVGFVAGCGKPIVVGIAGSENAGKTTLLAAWYLLLGQGSLSAIGCHFAASYSLEGWEAVAGSLRWDAGRSATFPPHTSSGSGRTPGLLHLALRKGDRRSSDFLFADASGEWFRKWAINQNAPDAAGAQWVSEHADVILLVADRDALSGSSKGSSRGAFQLLARRVAATRGSRPVALVWTKADVTIDAAMETTIRRSVFDLMPDAAEFAVSIVAEAGDVGSGLIELFDWTTGVRRRGVTLPAPTSSAVDPLFLVVAR